MDRLKSLLQTVQFCAVVEIGKITSLIRNEPLNAVLFYRRLSTFACRSFQQLNWGLTKKRCLGKKKPYHHFSSVPSSLVVFRSSGEELKDGGGGPDAAHHHGHEGQDEDPWEKQARDLWGDPESVQYVQDAPRPAHEEHQAERPGRHLQVVGQDHHQQYVQHVYSYWNTISKG